MPSPALVRRARRRLCQRRVALAAASVVVLGCSGASTAFGAPPDATFATLPADPVAGQTVRFVSYACDPDGGLIEQAWDLDGDGSFNDGFGPSASRVFGPGSPAVALRVIDDEGTAVVRRRTLIVTPGQPEYVVPRPSRIPLLSPFPIVRLAGRVTATGVRVRILTVRSAPACSRVTVRCRGRGCPWRRSTKVMGQRPIRFRALERHFAAGVVLEVLIRKPDRIGKYTRFRLRRAPRPLVRRDLCLRFEDSRGTPCPLD